jgi:acyl-CoA dehydrogenase
MGVLDIERADFLKDEDILIFEESVGRFFEEHAPPERVDKWRRDGIVERAMWREAGEASLLCLSVPEQYGGQGGDFRHEAILMEQTSRRQVSGFATSLHNVIVVPYILHYGSEEQKKRWLPKMASGEFIGAIAMTEPGAGSDLQGVRTTARLDGNHYVINGQKTFISNGQLADLIIVVAKTDPSKGAKGTSLIVVETADAPGFQRGRNLDKIGMEAQDTSELFFDGVRVPTANLLGAQEGQGFAQLMQQLPQERLSIAISGVAAIERALEDTMPMSRAARPSASESSTFRTRSSSSPNARRRRRSRACSSTGWSGCILRASSTQRRRQWRNTGSRISRTRSSMLACNCLGASAI